MESQGEIVIAAEALRVWVRGQQAAWDDESDQIPVPSPVRTAPAVVPSIPVPPVAPPPQAAVVPEAITPRPVSLPLPAPVSAPPPVPQPVVEVPTPVVAAAPASAVAAAQTSDRPAPAQSIPFAAADFAPAASAKWRVAAVVALVALVVGGGFIWRRGAASPRVGAAAFDSLPAGAQVFVDGKPVGTTPVRVELNPGPHAVEFKLKDATRTQTIQIAKGLELPVNIEWNPRKKGGLQITSTPTPARVSIDGHERGQTPLTLGDLPVGTHTVQIESAAGSVRRKVEVTDGRTETLAESIYPGWLHVSAPIEVTVSDAGKGLQLDDGHRVLLKPGVHAIRIDNRELDFSLTRQVEIEPGGTARVAVEVPTSTLTVTGSTGAEVFVDGAKAGEIPLEEYRVKLGTRDVMVVDQSGVTRHVTVTVTTRPARIDVAATRP